MNNLALSRRGYAPCGQCAAMRATSTAVLIALALCGIVAPTLAQTFTWSGAQNANWSIGNNWVGGVAPAGTGAENLVFPNGAANLLTNNNMNNAAFNSITIKGRGYTLSNKAITLGAGGLADSSAAGTNTISFAVSFAATRTVTVSNAGTTLTISGVISGAGGFTKSGAGTVVLSAANTYSGVTTINAGAVAIAADAGLGSAPGAASPGKIVFGGGTLRTTATFTLAANRGIALTGAGTISTDPATTLTYGGIIAGAGSLTKTGTGTLILSGANTYSGVTTASAGALLVNGSQASSAVSVNGGTLGGTGTVGVISSTAAGGSVAPGQAGPGILRSSNVNWSSGSPTFVVELNGTTAGSGYDQLSVTGTVNLRGAALTGTMGFSPPTGTTFTIINNDGADAIVGTFAGLPEGSTVVLSGQSLTISYVGGTGNDVVLGAARPNLALSNNVAPAGISPPGTDLTYTVTITNNGSDNATSIVVVDTLAPTVQFKMGSVANTLPPGVSVVVAYSNDGGSTWTYVPVSSACSAPAGYDRCVNRVRWTFQNPVSATAPNNTATLRLIAQIR